MRNLILAIGVIICLSVCAQRVKKLVQSHIPPFSVGECFEAKTGGLAGDKAKVIENHIQTGESKISMEFKFLNQKVEMNFMSTFEEIRNGKPVKVSCE